jgi:hypothetical protein
MAITDIARTISNDVILDTLLLRLHTETAARRGGALALRLMDLDTEHCLVLLREKGGTIRWQPISPPHTTALTDHAACRGAVLLTDALLRYCDGHPAQPADTTTSGTASANTCPGSPPTACPHTGCGTSP